MISDPTVFGGIVYFTTHVPDQGASSACGQSGDAFLYGVNYTCGGGALESDSRTKYVGHGIGSAPVMSMRPGGTGITDIYATASGGAGTSALTQKLGNRPFNGQHDQYPLLEGSPDAVANNQGDISEVHFQ